MGNRPLVMLTNSPLPIWLSQASKFPSRLDRKTMSLPSGETAASNSSPWKSVSRSVLAPASGFRQK